MQWTQLALHIYGCQTHKYGGPTIVTNRDHRQARTKILSDPLQKKSANPWSTLLTGVELLFFFLFFSFFGFPIAYGVSRPGVRSEPQPQPKLQLQKHWILTHCAHPLCPPLILLHHRQNSNSCGLSKLNHARTSQSFVKLRLNK